MSKKSGVNYVHTMDGKEKKKYIEVVVNQYKNGKLLKSTTFGDENVKTITTSAYTIKESSPILYIGDTISGRYTYSSHPSPRIPIIKKSKAIIEDMIFDPRFPNKYKDANNRVRSVYGKSHIVVEECTPAGVTKAYENNLKLLADGLEIRRWGFGLFMSIRDVASVMRISYQQAYKLFKHNKIKGVIKERVENSTRYRVHEKYIRDMGYDI
jgi:hypothetical protein